MLFITRVGIYRSDTCESFNKFFADQFSDASQYDIKINSLRYIDSYRISTDMVFNFLHNVKPSKAPGHDGISGHYIY